MPEDEFPQPLGINARTGLPLEGLTPDALKAFRTRFGQPDPDLAEALEAKSAERNPNLSVKRKYDANALDQVGWSILFPYESDPRIKQALQPLIDHRAAQAVNPQLCRIFESGRDCCR